MNHNKVIKKETNSDKLAFVNLLLNSAQKCSLYTAWNQHNNHALHVMS